MEQLGPVDGGTEGAEAAVADPGEMELAARDVVEPAQAVEELREVPGAVVEEQPPPGRRRADHDVAAAQPLVLPEPEPGLDHRPVLPPGRQRDHHRIAARRIEVFGQDHGILDPRPVGRDDAAVFGGVRCAHGDHRDGGQHRRGRILQPCHHARELSNTGGCPRSSPRYRSGGSARLTGPLRPHPTARLRSPCSGGRSSGTCRGRRRRASGSRRRRARGRGRN